MDIGKALTFYTEDERWVEKLAIGTGVLLISTILSTILIGVLGYFIVLGYCIRLMNNVKNDVTPVLPEWDQWGDDLVRGLKLFVVQLVWSLPLIVVMVPLFIGAAMADSSQSGSEFFGTVLILCGSCLAFLYAIVLFLVQPGFTVAFAEREEISDGLQVTRIWNWTMERIGQVVLVMVVILVASFIVQTVAFIAGILLCLVGLVVTVPLSQLIVYLFTYHLYGQLAREGGSETSALTDAETLSASDDDWEPPASIIEE